MTSSFALLILSTAAVCWLVARAVRDHHEAMRQRSALLDEAEGLLSGAETSVGSDQFPIVTGRIADGRPVKIELIADSMITRRLPQLWLRVTLYEAAPNRPRIGALARPTGAEYYSLVHDMPHWMAPPTLASSMLVRGDGTGTPSQTQRVLGHFDVLFADPLVKEAVIGPNGVRIIRQAAQGERAAHLFLRQSRFVIPTVPAETIRAAIEMSRILAAVLPRAESVSATEAA